MQFVQVLDSSRPARSQPSGRKLSIVATPRDRWLSPFCLPHLKLILARARNTDEELSRYLTSAEERNSYLQGLQMLVGHTAVNSIFVVRDTL